MHSEPIGIAAAGKYTACNKPDEKAAGDGDEGIEPTRDLGAFPDPEHHCHSPGAADQCPGGIGTPAQDPEQEKPPFLNQLLGKNLLFIAKELGFEIKNKIFTKVSIDNLIPEKIDENGWGAFTGEFKTNFLLPSYIGLGNGITRGFGTIFSLNNPSGLISEASKEKTEEYIEEEINEEDEDITFVTMKDVPVINKRKKQKKRHAHHKKIQKQKKQRPTKNRHNIEKNNSNNNKTIDTDDDSRFNSEEYHQKQHDL